MSETIAKTGIKRDSNMIYYIKGGDVWGSPRKQPGQPKGKAQKVHAAGINLDYSKYLYFLTTGKDGCLEVGRKERQVGGSKRKTVKAAKPAAKKAAKPAAKKAAKPAAKKAAKPAAKKAAKPAAKKAAKPAAKKAAKPAAKKAAKKPAKKGKK